MKALEFINKIYLVVEVFHSNPFDKYYRIIDDNNEEQAFHADNFNVVEQDIVAPAIYKHFKHEQKPDKYIYATMGITQPINHDEFAKLYSTANDEDKLCAEHTETQECLLIIKKDGKLYSDSSKDICISSLVIYVSLYDNHLAYARPYEMFAGLVDKEKYPNVKQTFRLEMIKY